MSSTNHRLRDRAGRIVRALTAIGVLGLALAVVVCWIPLWPLSLVEHFRVQLVIGGALLVGTIAALHAWRIFDLALIATLIHAIPVTADLTARAPALPDGARIRVLTANVLTQNRQFDRLRRVIETETPDVIGLVEVDRAWLDALTPSLEGYAAIVEPRTDNFGIALFARGALEGSVEELGDRVPSIVAHVELRGIAFSAIVTHPIPPTSRAAFARGLAQLDAVADRARTLSGPVIATGDLNATPWSMPFRRFVTRSGLRDSRAGFGLQTSWPADGWLFRIPIDHVLVSSEIGVADRRLGPAIGSDHLPVIVDLVVPR